MALPYLWHFVIILLIWKCHFHVASSWSLSSYFQWLWLSRFIHVPDTVMSNYHFSTNMKYAFSVHLKADMGKRLLWEYTVEKSDPWKRNCQCPTPHFSFFSTEMRIVVYLTWIKNQNVKDKCLESEWTYRWVNTDTKGVKLFVCYHLLNGANHFHFLFLPSAVKHVKVLCAWCFGTNN